MLFSWWINVWRFYLYKQGPISRRALQAFASLPLESIIKMCQFCLVYRPGEVDLLKIDRLWTDLTDAGLVSNGQEMAVLPLYLTVFGQQIMGKQWSDALNSLQQILPRSFSKNGWHAWRRFAAATFAYYPLGLRQKPHLLLGTVPDYPEESLNSFVDAGKQAGWQISAAAAGKGKVHPLGLAAADWLPAQLLVQLAEDKPSDHGRYLRQLRSQRKWFSHYRKLPMFDQIWQGIYFNSLNDAQENSHLFSLEYPHHYSSEGRIKCSRRQSGSVATSQAGHGRAM